MHRLQLATIGLFAMQSRAAAAPKPFAPHNVGLQDVGWPQEKPTLTKGEAAG